MSLIIEYRIIHRFNDDGIWSDKNTVRVWENPKIIWSDGYVPTLSNACKSWYSCFLC